MVWRSKTQKFLTALSVCLSAFTGRFALWTVVGPDMQIFNAAPDGLDFVTVQSSETLGTRYWNFGLFVNQAVPCKR
jgi:hypothetical protein